MKTLDLKIAFLDLKLKFFSLSEEFVLILQKTLGVDIKELPSSFDKLSWRIGESGNVVHLELYYDGTVFIQLAHGFVYDHGPSGKKQPIFLVDKKNEKFFSLTNDDDLDKIIKKIKNHLEKNK